MREHIQEIEEDRPSHLRAGKYLNDRAGPGEVNRNNSLKGIEGSTAEQREGGEIQPNHTFGSINVSRRHKHKESWNAYLSSDSEE